MQPCLPFSFESQKAFGKHLDFVAQFAGRCKSSGICDKALQPGEKVKDSVAMGSDQSLAFCREESGSRRIDCKRPAPSQFQTYTEMLNPLTTRSQKVAPHHSATRESSVFVYQLKDGYCRALQRKKRVAMNVRWLLGELKILPGKELIGGQTGRI